MQTLTAQRKIAVALLAVLGATTFGGVAVQPAHAGSKTWRNIAIGAGAVTAYGLIKGKGKVATIGGIATAASYMKYRSTKKKEERRARERAANRARWRRTASYNRSRGRGNKYGHYKTTRYSRSYR